MGTVEGRVRFLQLLSCWVRVKPWVFLAFGDWKPLALDELAGGFMLTPLVISHPPVKIWWDWRDRGRYSKEPTLPLWWTLQISDFGRNPVGQNFHLFGGEWPHCRGDDADSVPPSLFHFLQTQWLQGGPHVSRQRARKANLLLLQGQAKPAVMQIYQSGWQGSSKSLGSVTRVSLCPQEHPNMDKTLLVDAQLCNGVTFLWAMGLHLVPPLPLSGQL